MITYLGGGPLIRLLEGMFGYSANDLVPIEKESPQAVYIYDSSGTQMCSILKSQRGKTWRYWAEEKPTLE